MSIPPEVPSELVPPVTSAPRSSSRVTTPLLAILFGIIGALPVVLIATASLSENSRPAVTSPTNPEQSLLGRVPYGTR